MGITGELVRNVFSKRHEYSHRKNNGVERKKWSNSVRSYLCGDEYNSVVAADDSNSTVGFASFRATNVSSNNGEADFILEMDTNSEATVNQPLDEKPKVESYKQLEDAALIIQSAFRGFMARRARDDDDAKMESVGTSIEVQIGNSRSQSFHEPRTIRSRARAQLHEDWDDSTVSSVISKMRIKNRMEAATRRERALAYAFSQQLRICSKKRESKGNDKGWSWLERWMAAREPDEKTSVFRKRTSSEKESCGSNEVSSLLEQLSLSRESKDIKKMCDVE